MIGEQVIDSQTSLSRNSIIWIPRYQASQWAGSGFKFLSPAHTRPKPWWPRPEPDQTRNIPGAQTAQIIQKQGLSQFYLKMSIFLTLAVESGLLFLLPRREWWKKKERMWYIPSYRGSGIL